MKVLKNVINVALANIASFGTSFIIGFILPAILTVAEYGYYKEYTLYLSFAYLYNLGFNSGIYLKYGGKNPDKLDYKQVKNEHNFILLFQFVLMVIFGIIFAIQGNITMSLFNIASFFFNMNDYHQGFLQATGKFQMFSRANILKSIFSVLLLIISIFYFKIDNYVFYIVLNILGFVFLTVYYEAYYLKDIGFSKTLSLNGISDMFRVGIFILIANMSLTFVGNIGSWIVNFGFNIESFAQYSFQNSLLNVILLIVNAVGVVFFNFLSKRSDKELIIIIKNACLLLGIYSGVAFFIFDIVINAFLPQYDSSLPLLSMTFLAIPFIMTSKILTANLYKSQRSEKKFFRDSVLYALISLVGISLVYLFTKNLMAIAFSTAVSYILWYVYAMNIEFKQAKGDKKEVVLLISFFFVFFMTSNILSTGTGIIIYTLYLLIVTLYYKKEIYDMREILK